MNTDTLQTILGLVRAAFIAAMDYVGHVVVNPDFSFMSWTFLAGIVWAIIEGVKGYYAAGIK
jgi:hypothetical protein